MSLTILRKVSVSGGTVLRAANNLGDLGSAATARSNLGAGDFNGPASATDNAIVRFDGTGGKTAQNSSVTITDSGVITSNVTSGVAVIDAIITTTAAKTIRLSNLTTTGGDFYFGIESSAAGSFFTGSQAYDSVLYSPNKPIFASTSQFRTSGFITAEGTGTHTFGTTNTVTMAAGKIVATAVGNAFGIATSATTFVNVAASTTGASSLRLAHGSAPTSPVNGDMWTTTAGLFVRINGATVGPLT